MRTLFGGRVLAGFAGGAADALTLFEKFEGHLERYQGNLQRATVEMAREWRSDRILRRLEAMLVVLNSENIYTVSGNGDVIEGEDGVSSVGSGAPYAMAAARALMRNTNYGAEKICREALSISGEICIYTNDHATVLTMAEGEGS